MYSSEGMDAVLASVVAGAGKMFGMDGKAPRRQPIVRQRVAANERPSGSNVYQSDRVNEIEASIQRRADLRYMQAQDPVSTNVIPPNFNTDMQASIDKFHSREKQSKIYSGPLFNNAITSGLDQSTANTLTGKPMEQFHNNMVPFIKDRDRQNMDDRAFEGRLETFTGVGDLIERHKSEISPMFAPVPESTWGTPGLPEHLREERYVNSVSNLKTNLLPAPQIRQGWFDPLDVRPMLPTIDDLRTTSNPKLEYSTLGVIPQGIAQSQTQRGIMAVPSKNRQQPVVWNGANYAMPGGVYQKEKSKENFILRHTNKSDQLQGYFGNAGWDGMYEQGGRFRRRNQHRGGIDSLLRASFRSETANPLKNLPIGVRNEAPTMRPFDKLKTTMRQLQNAVLTGNVGGSQIETGLGYQLEQKRAHFMPTNRESEQYTYRGGATNPVGAPTSEFAIRNNTLFSGKKSDALYAYTPGRGQGNDFYSADDVHMTFKDRFDQHLDRREKFITNGAMAETPSTALLGRVSNFSGRSIHHNDDRLDPGILDQLDTNNLVIH